jgi:leucyl-tRNA synthetase
MELTNKISEYIRGKVNKEVLTKVIETYIKLLAPLAPHFTEELWESLGKTTSIHKETWPKINEQELKGGSKEIPVQVNGKLKTRVLVNAELTPDEILDIIKQDEKVKDIFEKYNIIKEIYVPGKIYNIVAKLK